MTVQKLIDLYDAGKYTIVYDYCRKQLEWNPEDLNALFYAALVQAHFKMYDVALRTYQRILKTSPSEQYVYNNMGTIYLRQKRYARGVYCLKRELGLYPQSREANLNLGEFYFDKGQYAKAIPYLKKCVKVMRDENDIYTVQLLAEIYFKQKDLRRELAMHRLLLRRHPKNPMMLNNVAACYIDLGENKKGIKLLQKAISLAGNRRGFGCIRRNIKTVQSELQKSAKQ